MTQARSSQPIRGQNCRHCGARRLYALNDPKTSQLSHLQRQETLDWRFTHHAMRKDHLLPDYFSWKSRWRLQFLEWKTFFSRIINVCSKRTTFKEANGNQGNHQSKDTVAERWLLHYKLFICILIRP